MPQMAPSMWLPLFLVFLLSYILFMTLIYFFNIYNPQTSQVKKLSSKSINWKW